MAGKQIKHIRIETKSVGAKEAQKELAEIDLTITDLNKSISSFSKRSATMGNALTSLTKRAGSVNKNLAGISASLKAVNSASAGTAAQTKKLDGYITNLEILNSVLTDLALSANLAEAGLDGINATAGMKGLVSVLESIEFNTRKTAKYITDVELATDRASEEFQQYALDVKNADRATKGFNGTAQQTTAAMRQTTKAVGNQTKSFSALAFGANPLVSAYAAIAVNVFAISAAFQLLTDAAAFSRLQEQLTSFSAAVTGVDVNSLAIKLREASAGALSLKESLSFATKGVAFSFTSDQLDRLTASTRKASIALGRDFNDSMDRVLRGISKQEIELFDELGIVTRLTPAFQKYASEVGKTVDELTNYERQLALTNEVQGQLDEKFSGITAGATAWETLGVNAKDSTTSILVALSKALEPAAATLNEIVGYISTISAQGLISKEASTSAEIFSKALAQGNIGAAVTATGALAGKMEDLEARLKASKKAAADFEKTAGGTAQRVGESFVNLATEAAGITLGRAFMDMDELKESGNQVKTLFSDTQRLNNELALQATIEKELVELQKERNKQLSILTGREITQPIDKDTGTFFIAYIKSLNEGIAALEGLALAGQRTTGPLAGVQDALKELTTIPKNVEDGALALEAVLEQAKKFQEFQKSFGTDSSLDGVGKVADAVDQLALAYKQLPTQDSLISITTGEEGEAIKDMEKSIALRLALKAKESKLGKVISKDTVEKREEELKILNAKLAQLRVDEKLKKAIQQDELSTSIKLARQAEISTYESATLQIQLNSLAVQIVATNAAGKETTELEAQLALLAVKLGIQKDIEARERNTTLAMDQTAKLQTQLGKAGSEKDKVAIQQQLLDIRKDEVAAMVDGEEKLRALKAIDRDQGELDKSKNAAPFQDASSTFSAMAGMEGVTELQSATLGIAGTFSDTFAQAAEAGMEGFSGFTEFLSGNMEAFQSFAQGVADGIGSVYQASSDARVAGIDQEIAAEKKRDGKSAESLAKIKALEKKKIKEQAKAKKAQVVISTATAIAMSFAELGPIAGIAPAAMMAGMGVLQIASINKAANGQIAGLDSGAGGGSNMKIEGGNRRNDIDVSRNANAGELSFINGGQGQGTANNFITPGRAGGGTSSAGASIIVGERGAEEITPLVPVSVSPAGSKSGGGGMVFSPVFNVEAMDSAGFEAVTSRFSVELFNSLETELRARNLTLENLA